MSKVHNWLFDTNLWVALCPCFLVLFLHADVSYNTLVLVFFGSLFLYNFARINKVPFYFQDSIVENIHKVFAAVGFIGMLICLFYSEKGLRFLFHWTFTFGIWGFLYVLPLKKIGLRYLPMFKLFLIGWVWTGVVWVFPQESCSWDFFSPQLWQVFFYILALALPFDIRDSKSDDLSLKTLPQLVGINGSKCIAVACIIVSIVFSAMAYGISSKMVIWLVCGLLVIVFIYNSTKNIKSRLFFEGFGEGISLIPYGLLCSLEIIHKLCF